MDLPIAEAIFYVFMGLWILSLLLWGREEYWSPSDDRARFLPGTRLIHYLLYKNRKPVFKKGVKSGPGITPGN